MTISDIQADVSKIIGNDAWRASRTHGSMFFLEIGDKRVSKYQRRGETHEFTHGEWHFLVEMVNWRFEKAERVLIGSEDSQENIDACFEGLELGRIEALEMLTPSQDLRIVFESGAVFKTFSNTAVGEFSQWTLYCPNGRYWSADACNVLVTGDASDPRGSVSQ